MPETQTGAETSVTAHAEESTWTPVPVVVEPVVVVESVEPAEPFASVEPVEAVQTSEVEPGTVVETAPDGSGAPV